jgi:CRP-like cAMP-binding protein
MSSPNEKLKTDINNEDANKKIKHIYPKAKIFSKINKFENKIRALKHAEKKDTYELSKDFYNAIIQPIIPLDKYKVQNTISMLIRNSKLSQKLESESEINENINNLASLFTQNLTYKKINKDNLLFHTGEIDYKFYFIINGRMSELKPSKCHLQLTFADYILYLFELQRNNEKYLLNETLANNKDIPIKFIDDIQKLNTIIFKKQLIEKISLEKITNNDELEAFFKEYYQEFSSHYISIKVLKKLEKNRNKIIMGSVNREWDDYILEKCHPNPDDLLLFEPFEEIYKDPNHNYICYTFELINNYESGCYFGDFSLEEVKIIRNETIRADEDTIIGYISNEDYVNLISPRRKIEKRKEIMLLNNLCFFKNISERIFKKNYFEMFIKKEYSMKTVLFKSGSKPKSLLFLKQGKISLLLNCSIIEMHKLIISIYMKLNKISWPFDTFQKRILDKDNLKAIEKKFFDEPILKKMKTYNKIFKMELEKKRKFQIALFSDVEIIGLEEIYLNMPFISKGIVISDKIFLYELPLNKFNTILQDEMHNITESYVIFSINRILSLMERLNNLKQNYINIARIKSETASRDNYIKTENNSFDSNKDYMLKKNKNLDLNNINPINSNRLNINNSKTIIPSYFSTKINDNHMVRTESNDKDKKSYINISSRASSTKFRSNRKSSPTKKKKSIVEMNHSSSSKCSILKNVNNLKSAAKSRNSKFCLEKNDIIERAGSVKMSELLERLKREKMNKSPNKKNDFIIIGNKKININKLRRTINDYKTFDELRGNRRNNESKDISLDNEYIRIEEENKRQTVSKEQNIENSNDKIINKTNDTNISHRNDKFNISIKELSLTKKRERYTSLDLHVNKFNKINKINYTKILINQIPPLSINTFNKRNIKNLKQLNIGKININKKVITSCNTSNNVSLINQTTNTYTNTNNNNNNINNDTSIISILPKIRQKSKLTEYITKSSITNVNSFNRRIKPEKIPEIVKEYYSKIKKGGYIPLITKKESNTIFLRKYHKKYKDVEEQNKNLGKNEGLLPKLNNV